jgi:hypothetical protein
VCSQLRHVRNKYNSNKRLLTEFEVDSTPLNITLFYRAKCPNFRVYMRSGMNHQHSTIRSHACNLLLFAQENSVDNIQRQCIGRIHRLHSRVLHQWKPCLQDATLIQQGVYMASNCSSTILQDPYDKIPYRGEKCKYLQLQSMCGRCLPHYPVYLKFHHFPYPDNEYDLCNIWPSS